jgi:flagellar basal body-associated protein FliL
MEAQENKKTSWLPLVIIAILAIAAIILAIFLMLNSGKLKTLEAEKDAQRLAFQYELDSLLIEHENVKQEYGNLATTLNEKDSIIQANAQEIKRLLNTQWEYVQVQRKLELLRGISQGYLRQMDSLYTVNRELVAENVQIRANFERERMLTRELQKDKETLSEKVEEAAVLRAFNISATPINIRGLSGRESETDRARRVDLIRVCYSLAENSLAPAGQRNIYVRIARPDNLILIAGLGDDYSFMYQGNVMQYSQTRTVDYQNEELQICADWINRNTQESLMTGTYIVSIFADDHEIGQTSVNLR